ncbi:MAG: indolepyruvate ferredoxin oxidoreductase family protein [Alphaproteobacteria bacterium]
MKHIRLDDRYDLTQSRIFVNGAQTIVRLALMQQERDSRAGLNTAGYISGYRGSPLGGLDMQLEQAEEYLAERSILFQPGLNEDLAATAIWGAQQAELRGHGRYDGVFSIWYGKGPGVDRSGDAFRHANHAGTSPHGGVIALMGDDHTCESSTSAHQSEFKFIDAMMPVLNPAGLQEVLDYGLYGWAMSRFAGVWAGIKCVKDNIEQSGSIDADVDRLPIIVPEDFDMPPGGLSIRRVDNVLEKEARLFDFKIPAVRAFTRANKLDRYALDGGGAPRIGIITTGKSYLDTEEALDILGIGKLQAAALGVRLYKLGVTWPLEPQGAARFAEGLDLVIVVEEKRSLIETQLKELLYGQPKAPVIIGKKDEKGAQLFPSHAALEPLQIARAIGERLLERTKDTDLWLRMEELEALSSRVANVPGIIERVPYFCAGCPHNTSTVIPEGAHAYAGIGCHYMVQWMDRSTEGFTHMGGEGANWIGEAPFSNMNHVFQNIGDGTYVHSGALSIRAAIAAGTTMTFKILFNDAVAMTGGQGLDGQLSVPQLAHQMTADGASKVVVVAEDPSKYPSRSDFPSTVTIHHRDELEAVQRELQDVPGVSVLIYDQTCAAELRRRRKRGMAEDPPERVLINELVCEGCGDCGIQSNCVAIVPVDTEFGRKRAIDQSACNKDYSCLKGFCPSFVTVSGAVLRGAKSGGESGKGPDTGPALPPLPDIGKLPDPELPDLSRPFSMVITGVGGTGVITLGALVGMAAHLEEKGVGIIDMSGLAQKGGAVAVHLRVGAHPRDIKSIRASASGADVVLGCDLVVAASDPVLRVVLKGVTSVIANDHEMMTGDFTRQRDLHMPMDEMRGALSERAGAGASRFIEAHALAKSLLGDVMFANVFLLGYAFQLGKVPVSAKALEEAIELNGVAVKRNLDAFGWGRFAAQNPQELEDLLKSVMQLPVEAVRPQTLDDVIARRVEFLTDYQDKNYAQRYKRRVDAIRKLEMERAPGSSALANAVAQGLFKLMAYKDEYEVARLFTSQAFKRQLESTFTGQPRLKFHLAPPILSKADPLTGRPAKRKFGPWAMRLFGLLARFKWLRGTAFDPFKRSEDRLLEWRLLEDYETVLDEFSEWLNPDTLGIAVELASLPETIRGYGPLKKQAADAADLRRKELLSALRGGTPERRHAA